MVQLLFLKTKLNSRLLNALMKDKYISCHILLQFSTLPPLNLCTLGLIKHFIHICNLRRYEYATHDQEESRSNNSIYDNQVLFFTKSLFLNSLKTSFLSNECSWSMNPGLGSAIFLYLWTFCRALSIDIFSDKAMKEIAMATERDFPWAQWTRQEWPITISVE